jgi:hypothetical protein
MNEKIYKLSKQADALAREIEPDLREIVRYNRIRDEKFAELLIQECCAIADQVEQADMDSYASKYIRAHFGVEL